MIRLGRRTSLLVACCMLTSSATAHAECAWVLWGYGSDKGVFSQMPVAAWATRQECTDDQAKRAKGTEKMVFVCLPDTVDPRGAKGAR